MPLRACALSVSAAGPHPEFRGGELAAARLLEIEPWKSTTAIKVNPVSPQRPLRAEALRPYQGRTFAIDELEGYRVEFHLCPDGEVGELVFNQPNGTLVARRAEVAAPQSRMVSGSWVMLGAKIEPLERNHARRYQFGSGRGKIHRGSLTMAAVRQGHRPLHRFPRRQRRRHRCQPPDGLDRHCRPLDRDFRQARSARRFG